MSYTELPPGPLPQHCSECGLRMKVKVVGMLPYDPQTGELTPWRVVACPLHEGGNWGRKHHHDFWRAWYHDGFMIEPVPPEPKVPEAPSKYGWMWKVLGALVGAWIVIMFVVGMAQEILRPPM